MTARRLIPSLAAALLVATSAAAEPAADTCRILDVTGGNKVDEVAPLIVALATRWTPENRARAIETLQALLRDVRFDGGNAYVVARLGEDYEDHVLALRIVGGELAAARLTYEWTPDGMRLTVLNFQRRISALFPVGMPLAAEPIDCGG